MFHASSLAATRPISAHVWRTLLVACATGPALAGAAFACFAPLASAPAMFARPLTRRGPRPRPNREPAAAPAPPAGDPRPRKARARAPRSALLALAPAPAWRAACGPRRPRALARRLAVRAAATARATHMCRVSCARARAASACLVRTITSHASVPLQCSPVCTLFQLQDSAYCIILLCAALGARARPQAPPASAPPRRCSAPSSASKAAASSAEGRGGGGSGTTGDSGSFVRAAAADEGEGDWDGDVAVEPAPLGDAPLSQSGDARALLPPPLSATM